MASISGVLQDNDGNDLYPYTFDQEVLDANNVPISQRLGSASEASAVSGSSAFAKINTLSSDLASKSRIDIYHLTGVGTDTWGYNNLSNYGITPNQIISVLPYDSVTDGKYNVHDGCLNNKIVFEWYTNTTTNQLMMRNVNGGSAIGAAVTVLIA